MRKLAYMRMCAWHTLPLCESTAAATIVSWGRANAKIFLISPVQNRAPHGKTALDHSFTVHLFTRASTLERGPGKSRYIS